MLYFTEPGAAVSQTSTTGLPGHVRGLIHPLYTPRVLFAKGLIASSPHMSHLIAIYVSSSFAKERKQISYDGGWWLRHSVYSPNDSWSSGLVGFYYFFAREKRSASGTN